MAKSTGFTTAALALLFAFFILVASFGECGNGGSKAVREAKRHMVRSLRQLIGM
ncbi:hypothetical protein OROMI_014394 [Orobanche minor]